MKRLIHFAAALFAATAAYAQTYEPAVPRGLTDGGAPQSRELAQPAPAPAAPGVQTVDPVIPKLVMDSRRGTSDADARNCLHLASNRQIHRCAERYRPRASRPGVTRTRAAKPAEAAAASRARAAEIAKPDLSKAAPAAKPVETARAVPPVAPPPVVEKPGPKAALPEKTADKSAEKGKWTDGAKALLHKQGDRLP